MPTTTPTVIRGGVLYDGTGAAPRRADVRIADGRISDVAAAGTIAADQGEVIVDLNGMALAPGFIDIHTHYDAQVTWDPDLVPSSWHGVTTVVLGNCGYSLAPTRPRDREVIVKTLEAVEGMSAESLDAGIVWDFETFGEYLGQIDGSLRLNAAALVGHTALRLFVMGSAAMEREATSDEVAAMADVLRDGLRAGAIGFSTSRASVDNGAYGKPVPSRLATHDELLTLCRVTGEAGGRVIQIIPGAEPLSLMGRAPSISVARQPSDSPLLRLPPTFAAPAAAQTLCRSPRPLLPPSRLHRTAPSMTAGPGPHPPHHRRWI